MSQRIINQSDLNSLLLAAFVQVKGDKHSDPIDVVVPFDAANIYLQAIEHFHGQRPQHSLVEIEGVRMFRLESVGGK